ncbi:MAG: hypothetical protein JWO60_852 [Frankiales bacterium]|nr:hypothetical protein [Frankiales bacterium]
MTGRHVAPEARGTGSRMVAVGAVLFLLGVVAVVVAVVPVLRGASEGPDLAATSSGVLLPLGLGLALGGLLRGARARRRAARRPPAERSSTPT